MSYYIRYMVTDDEPVTISELEKALQSLNPAYSIDGDTLLRDDEEFGQIEINVKGDGIFDGDIELLLEFAAEKRSRETLVALLHASQTMVTVSPIWQERDDDETLAAIQPLFDWLGGNRAGFMMLEGGMFYDASEALE